MTLIYLTVAWSLGILLARTLGLTMPWMSGLTLVGAVGLAAACVRRRGRLIAVLALALLAGGWRYALAQPAFDASALASYNDSGSVTVWGYVSAEPSVRATYTQLEITAEWLDAGADPKPVCGKMILNAPPYPAYAYGDRLRLQGVLETPPIFDTFSYREYLAARGVHSLMRRPQITTQPGRGGSALLRDIYGIKATLRRTIEDVLPDPEAGLLAGIVLGLGHTLPDELLEAFRLAGLTHLIVISGFNIGVVAQAVMVLSQGWAHRWATLAGSLCAVALFVLLVGPSPPVMRAAWMGGLTIAAQLAGRRSHALTALAASCLIMTAGNPLLLWSVSFQLSFVSTLALILLEPALARRLHDWAVGDDGDTAHRHWFFLTRDVLIATLAAQLATLPLIWAHFGQISLLALLTNLVVLPLQPAIMALGLLAIGGGLVWLPLGRVLGWLVWPLLHLTIWVAQVCARIPRAGLRLAPPPWPLIWVLYGTMLLFAWRGAGRRDTAVRQERPDPRARRVVWAMLLTLVVTVALGEVGASLPDGRLHLYVLDVGQGDALLLRTPQGRLVLVDGGPDPLLLSSRLGQFLPFWRRRIDLVIATHADGDHLTGLIPVLKRYRVEQVLESPFMPPNPLVEAWRQATAQAQLTPTVAARGMRITMGADGAIEVLHPPPGQQLARSDNAASVVLRVTLGRCHMLLTADVDADVEREWLAVGLPLQATILKVAHHGAGNATSEGFLNAVNPQVALISVGGENRFGHPSLDTLAQLEAVGAQVLRTDQQGTLEVITDGTRIWIKTHDTR